MNFKQYPLRLPIEDARSLAAASEDSGLPVSQLIIQCVRQALPGVIATFRPKTARLTNVEPLDEEVLDRFYSRLDDDLEGVKRFTTAQALEAE
jgi:hypothetical protein